MKLAGADWGPSFGGAGRGTRREYNLLPKEKDCMALYSTQECGQQDKGS